MVEQSEENNVENDRREALATIAKLEEQKNQITRIAKNQGRIMGEIEGSQGFPYSS